VVKKKKEKKEKKRKAFLDQAQRIMAPPNSTTPTTPDVPERLLFHLVYL
jgi:hypothetical protein